jgi:uncharacterized membrane protein
MAGAPALEARAFGFLPLAISRDGATVLGRDFAEPSFAMRWSEESGEQFVTTLQLRVASADGSILVGEVTSGTGAQRAARWANGKRVEFEFPRATDTQSATIGASADASVVVGSAWSSSPFFTTSQAFRWTEAEGVEGLGFLPGDTTSEAAATSPDGATVVGLSYNLASRKARPFRWTKAEGMTELTAFAGSSLTVPVAVDDKGTVIGDAFFGGQVDFSSVSSATSRQSVLWTGVDARAISECAAGATEARFNATGWIMGSCGGELFVLSPNSEYSVYPAPTPPAGYFPSDQTVSPLAVSDDGGVVVARRALSSLGGTGTGVLVWKGGSKQVALALSKVITEGNVELSNLEPFGMSADGSTIFGIATGGHGWVLRH